MTNVSWHPGCPVSLAGLRLVHVSFHGFDGRDHVGVMAVSAGWATAIVGVFHRVFDLGFPIQRMQLVDDYGGSDDASVQANNTSAFNCRPVTGGTGFSRHSYGTAIDINPQQNPYVNADGTTEHANAQVYRNRSLQLPGMIHAGDAVVAAFAAIGWRWGGYFTGDIDYQHFDTAP
jgi:hypothetical protein